MTANLQDLMHLGAVPGLLPTADGRRVSLKSVERWARSGCRGVVLRTVALPRGRATTAAWLAEFLAALDAARRADGDNRHQPRIRPGRRLLRDRLLDSRTAEAAP